MKYHLILPLLTAIFLVGGLGWISPVVTAEEEVDTAVAEELREADAEMMPEAEVIAEPDMTVDAGTSGLIIKKISDQVFNDFVVGPGRYDAEIIPGECKVFEGQKSLLISNRMGRAKTFSITTEDITASTEGDKTISLLGDEVGPYTLKDLISVPTREFTLQHGERIQIPVTVCLPADMSPGGRYGSLLVSVVSDPDDSNIEQAPSSVVVTRIATLFFIATPGENIRSGSLQDFATLGNKKFFTQGPINFQIVHDNTGNTHYSPYGILTIKNILGEEVGYFELDPWYVMPNSLRNRQVAWERPALFGRYVAEVQINRGYDNQIDTRQFVFWVLPWKIIAGVFVGIFIFLFMLRFIFTRFEFKRKV